MELPLQDTSPARIHLVAGPVGAGKTTYATTLAASIGAVVFSIDQWMAELYGPDLEAGGGLQNLNPAWFTERVDRCERQIFAVSADVLAQGGAVVWDLGFVRRARRDRARSEADRLAGGGQLHLLTANSEIRRARVMARNATIQPGSRSMVVTPEMFAFAEHIFEPLSDEELAVATVVTTEGG